MASSPQPICGRNFFQLSLQIGGVYFITSSHFISFFVQSGQFCLLVMLFVSFTPWSFHCWNYGSNNLWKLSNWRGNLCSYYECYFQSHNWYVWKNVPLMKTGSTVMLIINWRLNNLKSKFGDTNDNFRKWCKCRSSLLRAAIIVVEHLKRVSHIFINI